MEKHVKPAVSFIRHSYLPHLGLAALLVLVSGAVLSFRNLDAGGAAKVMEMYAVLSGIILLVPLFLPEADAEIWDLERTKALPVWQLYLGRLAVALTALALVMGIFVLRLVCGDSEFDAGMLWTAAYCEAFFLGALGFAASAVTNQVVIGYMVSLLYYIGNIGIANRLGVFGLYPVTRSGSAHQGAFLGGAVLLAAAGILVRERKR